MCLKDFSDLVGKPLKIDYSKLTPDFWQSVRDMQLRNSLAFQKEDQDSRFTFEEMHQRYGV